MKRVLVTGAGGFIGSRCVRLLPALGYEVVATGRSTPAVADGIGVAVDLLDREAVRRVIADYRPTHLLHCAWAPVRGDVMNSFVNLEWARATIDLVSDFAAAGGERAALLGSCAEYDWEFGVCRTGQTPCEPRSLYGVAKLAVRTAVTPLAAASGLSIVWPRPFFLYGPGEHPSRLVAGAVHTLMNHGVFETTEGRQIRDYLFIDDLAEGIVAALDSDVAGPVDLCSGDRHAVKDLVTEVGEQLDRVDLVRLGAIPTRPGDPPVVLGDPEPASRLLGWRRRTTLTQGIAATIAFAREQLKETVSSAARLRSSILLFFCSITSSFYSSSYASYVLSSPALSTVE
jgi:nucleoside-diphosphate-sugar epimerase